MKQAARRPVDMEDLSTWTRHRQRLCKACRAYCCRLPVEVGIQDLIRLGVISEFDRQEPLKSIAKKLKKEGVVSRLHHKTEKLTLVQMANGDCLYLDPLDRKCTIYEKRPDTCRNHPHVGPRPGYCPYEPKRIDKKDQR